MDTTPQTLIEEAEAENAEAIASDIVAYLKTTTGVTLIFCEGNGRYVNITLPFFLPGGWKVELLAKYENDEIVIRGEDAMSKEYFDVNMMDADESFLWRQLYHPSFRGTPEDGLTAVCTRDTLAETACRFGQLMQAIAFCRYYNK